MPIYEYACPACGHTFDVLQNLADPPVATCPECGGKVDKRVSSPAIRFKGSGFYITDYTGKGQKPPDRSGDKATSAAPAKKKKKKKKGAS